MRTVLVLILLGGFSFGAGACKNKPRGHATMARCIDGTIKEMHVPLSKADEEPAFEDCGEGRCVVGDAKCPPSKAPAEKSN